MELGCEQGLYRIPKAYDLPTIPHTDVRGRRGNGRFLLLTSAQARKVSFGLERKEFCELVVHL